MSKIVVAKILRGEFYEINIDEKEWNADRKVKINDRILRKVFVKEGSIEYFQVQILEYLPGLLCIFWFYSFEERPGGRHNLVGFEGVQMDELLSY